MDYSSILAVLVTFVGVLQLVATLVLQRTRAFSSMVGTLSLELEMWRRLLSVAVLTFIALLVIDVTQAGSSSLRLMFVATAVVTLRRCIPPHVVFLGPSVRSSGRTVFRLTRLVAPLRVGHMLSLDELPWAVKLLAYRQSFRQRSGRWEHRLQDLLSFASFVIFDARVETSSLLTEALSLPIPEDARIFLLVDPRSRGEVFLQLHPAAVRKLGMEIVTIEQLYDTIFAAGLKALWFGGGTRVRRALDRELTGECLHCGCAIAAMFDIAMAMAPQRSASVIRTDQWATTSIVAWRCTRCGHVYCSPCAGQAVMDGDPEKVSINLKCLCCGSLDFQPGTNEGPQHGT